MARSGSTDFSVTAATLVKDALTALGVVDPNVGPNSDQQTQAIRALNFLVKNWMGPGSVVLPGFKVWQRTRATLSLTTKATYTMKSGGDLNTDPAVDILGITLVDTDSNEVPLAPMLMEDWETITNKTDTGDPTRYYYERQWDAGYLYLDFVPSDTTKTLDITYLRPLQDIDSATDELDFPQQYYRVIKWGLANELIPDYGVTGERAGRVERLAAQALATAATYYPEEADVYFQPGKDID